MYKKVIFGFFVIASQLMGDNTTDIDSLLLNIEKKTDLSEKTKLENSGISIIYTRDDLRQMQVKYLKDLLRLSPVFGYSENRYGLPDPVTYGDNVPFMSSILKVYIDNQEVTAGMYGSGILILGDLNMGFVDHVEMYIQAPSYEYSTEPTAMLIKLYSKNSQRDSGSKIGFEIGTNNTNRTSIYSCDDISETWSYFTYASYNDNKRTKYKNEGSELSRDAKREHLFMTLSSADHHILFNMTQTKRDAFIGLSLDATPEVSTLDSRSLHLGYDGHIQEFSFLLAYDYLKTKSDFEDNVTPLESLNYLYPIKSRSIDTISKMLTTELKYKNQWKKNKFIIGLKHRSKDSRYENYYFNGIKISEKKNQIQSIANGYIENQYSLFDNLIITGAAQYLYVQNINAKHNKKYTPLLYRYGLTYLIDSWIFKYIGSYTESYLEQYFVDSSLVVDDEIPGYKQYEMHIDITHQFENNRVEFMIGKTKTKDFLLPNPNNNGLLDAYSQVIDTTNILLRYQYDYNLHDSFKVDSIFSDINNLPDEDYTTYKVVVTALNSYKKFDFFNQLIYDNICKKDYYNLDFGVIYNYSDAFTLSFKATNILNKGKEVPYVIQNSQPPFNQEDPLYLPLEDRKLLLTMEYLF